MILIVTTQMTEISKLAVVLNSQAGDVFSRSRVSYQLTRYVTR